MDNAMSTPAARQAERDELNRQYAEFIARGGKVTELPPCLDFPDTDYDYDFDSADQVSDDDEEASLFEPGAGN